MTMKNKDEIPKSSVTVTKATDSYLLSVESAASALKNTILTTGNSYSSEDSENCRYLSTSGNDESNGLTPETAWATLDKLNSVSLPSGTIVFFERGGLWRGSITAQQGVTYTAYGTGEKPMLYGSPYDGVQTGIWEPTGVPNVYRYSIRMTRDVGCILFDDGEQNAVKILPNFIPEIGYSYDRTYCEDFTSYKDLHRDLDFFHDMGGGVTSVPSDDYGYIYLCSAEGNPAERFDSIEFNIRKVIVSVHADDVTVDNLCIKYGGDHGIGGGNVSGLTVKNCEIGWIGGSIQYYSAKNEAVRYGNGVELYGNINDYTVEHCYIYQIYDAGVTYQGSGIQRNISFTKNLIERCAYSIEYYNGKKKYPNCFTENILFSDNILRFAGDGLPTQRPIGRKWYGHLKSWVSHPNIASNFLIENNIMQYSGWMMIDAGAVEEESLPDIHGNTFIQYLDGDFALHSQYPMVALKFNMMDISKAEKLYDNSFFYTRLGSGQTG